VFTFRSFPTGFILLTLLLQACDSSDSEGTNATGAESAEPICSESAMKKLEVNDIALCYQSIGEGDPVVLVHGLGSSSRDWELQVPTLSESHRVITVDLRGHGQSDKPEGPYSIELFANDLHSLIEREAPEGAHVVGISMGAMVAVQYALDHPSFVKTVVAVNSPPDMRPKGVKQHLQVVQRKVLVKLFGMKKVGEVLADRLFPGEQHEATRTTFAQRWAENDTDAYSHSFNAILDWSVVDRLSEFQPPLLVMAADQDYLPLSSKQVFIDEVPNATLTVIENSRHATPVEHPDIFNSELIKWLGSH